MGIFDFLRRKQPPSAPSPGEEDLGRPRCHHYTLAHLALRSVAFANPLAFLGVLASPEAQRLLTDLMQSVCEHCKGRELRPDFTVEDIRLHKVRLGPYPCALIEMPRPRATTEAFFVAAVLLADVDREMPDPGDAALRYFTLEKGFVLDGPPRTVLCEWTREGTHVNYGDGPAAQPEAFLGAVQALVSKSQ